MRWCRPGALMRQSSRSRPTWPSSSATRASRGWKSRWRAGPRTAAVRWKGRMRFCRPAYEVGGDHALPVAVAAAVAHVTGLHARTGGASFWTDAAVLAQAGIPAVLFGPGGAGLHSTEEYVNVADVAICRDALVEFVRRWNS